MGGGGKANTGLRYSGIQEANSMCIAHVPLNCHPAGGRSGRGAVHQLAAN